MTTKHRIVLIAFPFDDLSATKVRPAVCLTNPIGPHRHVVFAFITSHIPAHLLPTDLILESSDPAFPTTGLLISSTIQLHRLLQGQQCSSSAILAQSHPSFDPRLINVCAAFSTWRSNLQR